MFLDGSPQGRTAWLRRPYQGEQEYRGYGTLTDAEVLDMVRRAGTDGMQLLAHCNGDAACAQYLAALDAAAEYRFIRTVSVYGAAVLPLLAAKMAPGGVVLCETEREADLPEQAGSLTLVKQYNYGKIKVSRYERGEEA